MATRAFLLPLSFLITCFLSPRLSSALYEDQVGIVDWHHQYLGKVNHAVFHTQKAGRKRVVVSTEENAIASLDLRRGGIFWRHLLKGNDQIDHIDIALGKYVVTLSSGGSILRAWNLPDGQMVWESVLQTSIPSKSLLHVPESSTGDKNSLLFVFGGGWLHAISGIDGDVVWSKDLSPESVQIQQIYQHSREGIIYAVGFGGSSQVDIYEISSGAGHLLKHQTAIYSGKFSRDFLFIHKELLVALDSTKSKIVLVNFQGGEITFHETYISDLVHDFSGEALILPLKFSDMFVLTLPSCTVLIKVKNGKEVLMIERIGNPASVSDALFLSEGKQAFATVHHTNNHVHITVKLESDLAKEVLKESIEMDHQKGHVQKVFINNYIRTDRSHGFRALLVMEDHSLQLVQQGEVVWSREDGLASIVDSTVSELPVEKDGVSVSKVEHSLFEWLKGHFLKLKGTLMLASPDDLAAIQDMRLRNSEKNKMTRDHNGFRKLVIVLTRAGKVLALHTGDGRVVWSILLSSICGRQTCQNPTWLNIHQWQVPHHHALDENPSVFIVGRCGENSDSKGILSVIDSYTGKEISSWQVSHSISQVMPLPLKDPKEQHLHLIIDSNNDVHLYPKSFDSLDTFLPELGNVYWYSIDRKNGIIRGHALDEKCHLNESDEYCFGTRNIWSIVLPSDTERIIKTTRRQLNEVVHTQAKVLGDQDVMYKYISNNVLFVATASPKAAGEIGSAAPEEARLVVYLIDVVTGRVIHRVTHHGSQGPVHAVFSEHWVAYHYFNLRAHRYEMSVIEIYDESRAGNKDVLKLVLGKHNLTLPISSYSLPEVVVKSQSYFFTHSVKTIAVTLTAKGITSKQVLIGTIGDQVLALDKRFLDPRRSLTPTQSEKEEGIIPLTESLPIIPQSYVTHSLQVEGLRKIVTIPAKLESTTLIFSYGIDLFFTRIAPSRTYDSLTEDFNYALLLITIFALVAAIFVTWVLSEQKELRDKWR